MDIEALKALRRPHVQCDDPWYSCPATGECTNEAAGEACNCGADAHNKRLAAILAASQPEQESSWQQPVAAGMAKASDGEIKTCPDLLRETRAQLADARAKLDACAPFLKEDETPAECIERNRADLYSVLRLLATEKRNNEDARAKLAAVEKLADEWARSNDRGWISNIADEFRAALAATGREESRV